MVRNSIQKLKRFVTKYEKALSAGSLFVGFVIDNLTLSRIDRLFENLAIISYILIVGIAIVLMVRFKRNPPQGTFLKKLHLILPFAIPFAFGGLFSGFTIFYSRSGSIGANWIFMLILVGMLLGTELFKRQYERLAFQIVAYFSASFFMFIYILPILTGWMGPGAFMLSGLLSLIFIGIYLLILSGFIWKELRPIRAHLVLGIAGVYALMHILYFTNSIPPIPLALKDEVVAHTLMRRGSEYILGVEGERSFWKIGKETVHFVPGEQVYVYSAIFAPTKIDADISHRWSRFDEEQKKWIEVARPSFPISGGSTRGYRGYSFITLYTPGKWRVDVENNRGQVIGRTTFLAQSSWVMPELISVVR